MFGYVKELVGGEGDHDEASPDNGRRRFCRRVLKGRRPAFSHSGRRSAWGDRKKQERVTPISTTTPRSYSMKAECREKHAMAAFLPTVQSGGTNAR